MTFSWTKALGYGVLTWLFMALALLILAQFESVTPIWAHSIAAAIAGVSAFFFGRNAKSTSGGQALEYGLVFAAVLMVLDLAVTQWYDEHIFGSWQYWASYALVLVAPWIQEETHEVSGAHA
jgi:hypothetical protein